MKRLNSIIVVLFFGIGSLPAQTTLTPKSTFAFNFDFARFRDDDTTKYVETYFAVFPQLVTLAKTDSGFCGFVDLQTEIEDVTTGRHIVRRRSLLPVRIKDTLDVSYRNVLVTQMGFLVPTGNYTLRVVAVDSLDKRRRDSVSVQLLLKDDGPDLSMSDLELCSMIRQSQNQNAPFYKNSHEVIPNPTLLFGAANHPVIFHYVELYRLREGETYTIRTILADPDGNPVQESAKKRKYGTESAVEVGVTSAAKLNSGKYRFQIQILDESSRLLAMAEKRIFLYNPNVAATVTSDAKMMETELSGLTADELDQEFDYLRFQVTEEQRKLYSQLTSAAGKREFVAGLWSGLQQGRGGRPSISRQEYLSRIKRSNERFRVFSKEGWRTDRGRVLILYGEPDEIERKPSAESGKPYEVWHYYQIESGVEFVYVDRSGFGEYVLVHSTKRGELRDETWRRLLQ